MSKYEWEQGSVVLPPAEARKIRALLMGAHEVNRQKVLAEVDSFLKTKGSGGRTPETFGKTLETWRAARNTQVEQQQERDRRYSSSRYGYDDDDGDEDDDPIYEAYSYFYSRQSKGNIERPSRSEITAAFPPRPKNRQT